MELSLANTQKAETFTGIFQHLKIFTEHVNLQLSSDKLYIQGMDSSHVSIYEVSIPAAWFDKFEGLKDKSVSLGINTNIFFKILAAREKTQTLNIAYDDSKDDDKLFVHFLDGKEKNDFAQHFEIPLVELTTDILHIPDIEYQAEFSLSSVKISAIVNRLKMFGDIMNIVCTEQKITISSEDHNTGKMNVEINIEELSSYAIEEGRDIILYYSLNYISNICMFNKLSSEVEISLSEDYPMKMNYVIGENANMCFYLAPKAAE